MNGVCQRIPVFAYAFRGTPYNKLLNVSTGNKLKSILAFVCFSSLMSLHIVTDK